MTIKQGEVAPDGTDQCQVPDGWEGPEGWCESSASASWPAWLSTAPFPLSLSEPPLCQSRTTDTHETGQDPSPRVPAFASEGSYLGFCMSFTFSLGLVPLRVISSCKWTFEEGWSTFRRWFCIWIRGNHHTQCRRKCLVFLRQQRRLLRNNSNNKPKNKQTKTKTPKIKNKKYPPLFFKL